jgi:sterol 3beta-glucosyltransferase
LVPELDDYQANRPIIGFLTPDRELRERLGEQDVDPGLDTWLTNGEPPVYVGFGSMPVIDPVVMMSMITTAAGRLGSRALIGAGWSQFGVPQGSGDRVKVVTGVLNYARVLPRCRVAVHHGGSGTVAASVAAGIPTFICSVVADNPFWGARVQQLGIGVHERFADLTQDKLEAGLRRALRGQVVSRAREFGATLRADTGAAPRAAGLIDSRLPG